MTFSFGRMLMFVRDLHCPRCLDGCVKLERVVRMIQKLLR